MDNGRIRLIARIVRTVTPPGGFEDGKALDVAVSRRLQAERIPYTHAQLCDAIGLVATNTRLVRPTPQPSARAVHQPSWQPSIGRIEAAGLLRLIEQQLGVTVQIGAMR